MGRSMLRPYKPCQWRGLAMLETREIVIVASILMKTEARVTCTAQD